MARKTVKTNKAQKFNLYETITNKFLDALAAGTVPWHNPVKLGNWPANLKTQNAYRGVNVWQTVGASMANSYSSRWWLSYKQATEMGGQVRQGEKSTLIVYWLFKESVDANGNKKKRGIPLYSRVFNTDQIDGIEDKVAAANAKNAPLEFEADDMAEKILADYLAAGGPEIIEGGYFGEGAGAYSPKMDEILMPKREHFESEASWYSTLFHEAGHSTAHPDRCNRPDGFKITEKGDENYSFEELVAEMTAAFLCGHSGIEGDFDNSAGYIAGWLDKLRGEPKWVMQAASKAQRATDYILGTTFEQADDEQDEACEATES